MADPLTLKILQTVRNSKTPTVPLEYLTFRLGVEKQQIERSIDLLAEQGVLTRTQDDGVLLASSQPATMTE